MLVFRSSAFAVLLSSLFTAHLAPVTSHPNPADEQHGSHDVSLSNSNLGGPAPAFISSPLEKGHGPQVSPTLPTPPRLFAWDRKLHIDRGNVVVVNVKTGEPAYTISQSPQDHRTTIVSNIHGDQLLSVRLKKSAFGRSTRYDTPSGVHYSIDPRMALTDHWYMVMEGKQPETLKYFRGRTDNTGNVYFQGHNQTKVASFNFVKSLDKSHWAKDALGDIKKIVTMEITAPTEIGDQYFIGLWALVKRRMDRFGA